jgi:hypothetical protein
MQLLIEKWNLKQLKRFLWQKEVYVAYSQM